MKTTAMPTTYPSLGSGSDTLIDDCEALPDSPAAEDLVAVPANEPARVTADKFLASLRERGLRYSLCWRWSGRGRAGVLAVIDDKGEQVFERVFERNTRAWGNSDMHIRRVRTGSPKHRAICAALAHISEH